ncbi:thioesterase [Fulvivirga sp. 29W222]|uniref:Thioesterase n=1 Tax=Fulvivirga marina TaxID=2494733 RepID=A0A937G0D8_9BACT|nr:thioesterase [Fulvivirga marina]MBL6448212.1 thioesterase [Fulvivirga marina]
MMMNKIKLFCLPYAGGSAVLYNQWKDYLEPYIELRPIELAGRGKRIADPLYDNIDAMINDVYEQIAKEIEHEPYLLFGHSLGGVVAYEVAQKIKQNGLPDPLNLIISGREAPHVTRTDKKKYHLMSTDELKCKVIALGGTSPEFFKYPELMNLFLPLLRNDLKLIENYTHSAEITPLTCDITLFFGKEDDLTEEQCYGWSQYTQANFQLHYLEGGHFFLISEQEKITTIINRVCKESLITYL